MTPRIFRPPICDSRLPFPLCGGNSQVPDLLRDDKNGGYAMAKFELLRQINIGQRTAEEEKDQLARYFVETEYWRKIFRGESDIVYGSKGTGKSAIYLLIIDHEDSLFDKGILLTSAENVRGAPVFQDLITDPPATEREFIGLWKLYFLTLIGRTLRDFDIRNEMAAKVQSPLESIGLLDREISLRGVLGLVKDYVRKVLVAEAPRELQGGVQIDPNTGLPIGVTGKIVFREPNREGRQLGMVSADELLRVADEALHAADLSLWILLDRLDVAFADSADLESNALRALFRVYRDLRDLEHVSPKIFLRSDIWRRITESGFRESSHITSTVTLEWDTNSLLNLIVRRLLSNDEVCLAYNVNREGVLESIDEQWKLFYRVFPAQVDLGAKKPSSFDWLLSRTVDGFERPAPRELIHLISAMRDVQLKMLERGESGPGEEVLFDRSTFKAALPEVSRVRLEQTLFAEYPEVREWLLALKGKKTEQDIATLSAIWATSEEETLQRAARVVDIGFFVKRTEKETPTYWVPFLYRDALEMVQGRAEEADEAFLDLRSQ